jgi:hypothetical protein
MINALIYCAVNNKEYSPLRKLPMNLLHSDLILLHAPSVYDFRKKSILYGPISDVIPSTPVFEMYPIGFSSLLEYLYQRGMKVRIINRLI